MLELKRHPEFLNTTPGSILFNGNFICHSIELPWRDNQHGLSCIPLGNYKIALTFSNRFHRNMYQILNVLNRDGIRIHAGNSVEDSIGCILPVKNFTIVNDRLWGWESVNSLQKLENLILVEKVNQLLLS